MVNKKLSIEIELVKWLAIISIFIFHYSDTLVRYNIYELNIILEKILHIGSQGIHIFFIFSSFFLYIKYIENHAEFKIMKRLKKLYPQYIISVLFILSVYFLFNKIFTLDVIIANILPIIRNLSGDYIRTINANWWFLHTLIEFYIFFWIFKKKLSKLSSSKIIFYSIGLYFIYVSFYTFVLQIDSRELNPFSSFFLNYIYDFSIGILSARYYVRYTKNEYKLLPFIEKRIKDPLSLIIIGVGFELIGLMATKFFAIFGYNINDIFFSFGIIFLLFGVAKLLIHLNFLKVFINLLVKKTSIIYLIYLIHHPIIILGTSLIPDNEIYYLIISLLFVSFLTVLISILLLKLEFLLKFKNV